MENRKLVINLIKEIRQKQLERLNNVEKNY